jgi:hypothetical protein
MELANNDTDFKQLELELTTYLSTGTPHEQETRYAAFRAAVARQHDRSMIELATFRELMGQPVTV